MKYMPTFLFFGVNLKINAVFFAILLIVSIFDRQLISYTQLIFIKLKMEKLFNFLKSFAVRNWQKYSFKKEWAAVIVLLLVLKLATSAVSIFSGWFYLDNFFFSFTDSETASTTFAAVALVLIEGLCALFLAKFFKFAIRLEFLTALMPLVCAGIVFTLSFIISTNGIALYANKAEDLSKEINAKYNAAVSAAQAQCAADILTENDYIATLKANPQGWSGGKRCMLSDFQTKEVAKAYDNIESHKRGLATQLKEIEAARNIELADNNRTTLDTADKYYKIVAFIMLIQVVCSGGLWFFWCKIAGQDAPEVDYKESVQDIYNQTNTMIDDGIKTSIAIKFNVLTDAFKQMHDDLTRREIAAKSRPHAVAATARRTGFAVPDTAETPADNATNNAPKNGDSETQINAATLGVSAVSNTVKTPQNNALYICEECGSPLNDSQIVRKARFCCAKCRVTHYNKTHATRKPVIIADANLSH